MFPAHLGAMKISPRPVLLATHPSSPPHSQQTDDRITLDPELVAELLMGETQKQLAREALARMGQETLAHIPEKGETLWQHGSGCNLALEVFFRKVSARCLDTGETLWTHEERPDLFGGLRPLGPEPGGSRLALTDGHQGVTVLDGLSGEVTRTITPPKKGYLTHSKFTRQGQLIVGVTPSVPSGTKPRTTIYGYDPEQPEELGSLSFLTNSTASSVRPAPLTAAFSTLPILTSTSSTPSIPRTEPWPGVARSTRPTTLRWLKTEP